ncbi:MAG: ABC transporter substrate-binding protein, partial [Chloroflexota bacterium]
MKKILIMIVVLALSVMAFAGVQAQDDTETYVLGVVQPFTGSLGEFGSDFTRGIELAVAEMNAELEAAGNPVRFEIASADTEGTPDGAARGVQTVVQTTGAEVIVGPLTTAEVLGAKQFADENGVVLVAPASSGPAGAIPGDNIFRVMYPPDTFAANAFSQIAQTRGYENVVILYIDDPFGNGINTVFTNEFEAAGGTVSSISYAPDPTDLSSEATAISAELASMGENTAFLCVCFLADAQRLLQVAIVDPMLSSVEWMGVENLTNPEILSDPAFGEFLRDANFISVAAASTSTPLTQPFIDAFVEMHGSEPGPFTNYAYDAANIAMLSMVIAGNDGDGVKSVLPWVSNHYVGTAQQAFLDENGDQAIVNYGI